MLGATKLHLGTSAVASLRTNSRRFQRNRAAASTEPQTETAAPEVPPPQPKDSLYIGKGRFSEFDPKNKERVAMKMTGRDSELTGGFAGGEVGLYQYIADLDDTSKKAKKVEKTSTSASPSNKSKTALYVGKGRYLPFEAANNEARTIKGTGRDSALTGGFSGGEVGLRKYVETGKVPYAPEGSVRQQQSPLIVAGILSASAVTGGILLNDVSVVGERVVSGSTGASPAALAGLDENTKLLLETAVLFIGIVATVVGGRAVVGSLTSSIKEGAVKLATLSLFWVAVFIAARFILDA